MNEINNRKVKGVGGLTPSTRARLDKVGKEGNPNSPLLEPNGMRDHHGSGSRVTCVLLGFSWQIRPNPREILAIAGGKPTIPELA